MTAILAIIDARSAQESVQLQSEDKIQHLIEQVDLFASLRRTEMSYVLRHAEVKRLSRGQVLIAAGTPFEAFYVVMSGHLAVYTKAKASGEPLLELGPGATVGEMSMVDRAPRSARVVAESEVLLFEFGEQFLMDAPQSLTLKLYQNLARIMAARLRDANVMVDTIAPWPTAPGERADVIRESGLRNLELDGVDMSGSQLECANLTKTNLRRANLEGADLRGANLRGAKFLKGDVERVLEAQRAAEHAEANEGGDGLDVSENWARLDEVIANKKSQFRRR